MACKNYPEHHTKIAYTDDDKGFYCCFKCLPASYGNHSKKCHKQAFPEEKHYQKIISQDSAVYKSSGSISKDEMLRLEAEASAASGRVNQLVIQKKRERLDYESAERERLQRHITAPIGGIVTKIIPQVGEWAKPGDPIMMLVDATTAELHVAVPHKEAIGLKVGAPQVIEFEAGSGVTSITGRISFISAVADPASGLVEMKISFANPKLMIKPGIKGSIDIKSSAPQP